MDSMFFQPSVRGIQGLVLYLLGDYTSAAKSYRAHFASQSRHEASAEQALLQGDAVSAEERAKQTLAHEPEDRDAWLDLSQSRLLLGDYAGAKNAATQLSAKHPNDPDRLVLSSLIATKAHDYDIAMRDMNLVLRNRGTASRLSLFILFMETVGELTDLQRGRRPYALLATYFRYLRIYDGSQGRVVIRHAEEAIKRNDHPGESYLSIGVVYDKKGDVDQALAAFLSAIERQPDLALAYWWASIEYGNHGDLAGEYKTAMMAFRTQPDDEFYDDKLAYVLVEKLGDYRQALLLAQQRLEINQNSASALGRIAHLYTLLGEFNEAVTYFKKAIALEPTDPRYFDGLGYSLSNLDRIDQAEEAFRTAITLNPYRGASHKALASMYDKKRLWSAAIREYEEAFRMEAPAIDAQARLCALYHLVGSYAQAAACFKEVLAKDPDNLQAQRMYPYTLKNLGRGVSS
jgi:tetratricopeptide (TPR) repeat protein